MNRISWLRGLVYVSLALHLVWLVVFGYLVSAGPFRDTTFSKVVLGVLQCGLCERTSDAVATAAEMGRLELLSISLTVLATVIGVGALASFFLVRSAAMEAAADEAVNHLNRKLPEMIDDDLIKTAILNEEQLLLTLANYVRKQISDLSDSEQELSDADADSIAQAIGGNG